MKRLNRLFSLLLAAVLLLTCAPHIPLTAQAYTVASGTCGANLTWKLTDDGTLTISGTGNMYSWDSDNMPWADYKYDGINSIIISPGVTSIGNNAFLGCDVVDVSIPSTVSKIGEYCFFYCRSLRQVVLPYGIRTIPSAAFYGCSSLESIILPSSVQSFSQSCFESCSTLSDFVIPDGVRTIPTCMFLGCSGLERVQIPSSVTLIEGLAFQDCGNLSDVYYGGSASQYNAIDIEFLDKYNQGLLYPTIHYNSKMPCAVCSYGAWTSNGSYYHERACIRCGNTQTQSHSWSSACDTKCDVCSGTRTGSDHTYSYECDMDCNSCGAKRSVTHTYSSECDTTCNVCGAVITSNTKHTLNGGKACSLCNTTFGDVGANSWQIGPVAYAYENGLMAGKGADAKGAIKFDPNSPITREEFVQVLYNAENKPAVTAENTFPDVASNGWYKNAVLWAKENNIASGLGTGEFGVGKHITRQDLAVMLYKYAKLKGYSLDAETGKIDQFGDGAKVSGYAKTAMDWAVTNGIMKGSGSGDDLSTYKLNPAGKATRAECAAMLKNFMTAFNP